MSLTETMAKRMANLKRTPEQRREDQKKGSVTRRQKMEKEYLEMWTKVQEQGLVGKTSRETATALGTYPGKVLAMRRYVKSLSEVA